MITLSSSVVYSGQYTRPVSNGGRFSWKSKVLNCQKRIEDLSLGSLMINVVLLGSTVGSTSDLRLTVVYIPENPK